MSTGQTCLQHWLNTKDGRIFSDVVPDYMQQLEQQKYNNTRRIYWYGSHERGLRVLEPRAFDGFFHSEKTPVLWITTNLDYALNAYADESLYMCCLTRPVDVFNARSDFDLHKLRERANLSFSPYEEDTLKNTDWMDFEENPRSRFHRDTLLALLKKNHYDGVFNWERQEHYPALGLFDGNLVKIVSEFTKDKNDNVTDKEGHDIHSFGKEI